MQDDQSPERDLSPGVHLDSVARRRSRSRGDDSDAELQGKVEKKRVPTKFKKMIYQLPAAYDFARWQTGTCRDWIDQRYCMTAESGECTYRHGFSTNFQGGFGSTPQPLPFGECNKFNRTGQCDVSYCPYRHITTARRLSSRL